MWNDYCLVQPVHCQRGGPHPLGSVLPKRDLRVEVVIKVAFGISGGVGRRIGEGKEVHGGEICPQ
jgi:hypothetical protein